MPAVTNWFGNITSHPAVVVEAASVDQIVAVIEETPGQYPSPVRARRFEPLYLALRHRRWRHLIRMAKMNDHPGDIGSDTVTAQAGRIYIDIAQELEKHGLQFYVNTEIGSLSAGSAACCGTKDASMPGEYGQVNSYVSGIKMVLPSGDLLEVTDGPARADAAGAFELRDLRDRLRGHVSGAADHADGGSPRDVHTRRVHRALPELKARGESMMFYIFPFDDLITVEFRHYNPKASGEPNRVAWPLRNYMWASAGPLFCSQVERRIRRQGHPLRRDQRLLRALAIQAGKPGHERLHHRRRPDHPLSRCRRRQPLHVQPLGISGGDLCRPCWPITSHSASSITSSRDTAPTC